MTEATGKTIAITISKAGGAFGNPNAGATNATEISSGWYKVTLDTTDTATLGVLALRGSAATIDDVGDRFFVVSASTGGLTNLDAAISSRMATYTQPTGFLAATFPGTVASTTNITAGTVTTATNVTTVNGLASGVITATSIAADAITDAKVASDVTIASVTGAVGSVTGNVGGNVTGSVGSVASGGITAASIAADAITAAKIADGAIDAATFASGALDAVWSTATRVLTAGTNIQLPSNGLANVTAWTVAITGNITGNLSGSVGSVTTVSDKTGYSLTQSFPSNFASLGIGAGGHILNVDTLTTYTGNTVQTGDAFARLGAPAGASVSADLAAVKAVDDAVKAKTDNLPASPAAVGSTMTLTADYDAAKTAATQTSVDDLPTNAELTTALAAADDATLAAIAALTIPTANQNADALLDRADAVEVGLSPRQAMRLAAAADAGKLSGAATTTNTIRNAVADSKNRIVATVDSDGNRTAITYDLT
ncbi:hypothetical protein [Bradyrhizobium sp. 150]|uniref:hypothetical protein n=1 Tax=Bradyrhizobium sp. 150 TaxID=2782625 RepID=UPI001FF8561C|nr:hypothetical protein [Bradyrhizobium sp. 150]MCK1670302.1 hypothetical protein [Bradyrhizobium sp. 150]